VLPSALIHHLAALSDEDGGALGNTVVTAILDPSSGALREVQGIKDKLKAAIKDIRVPRINYFAVADEQTDVLGEPGIKEHTRETESPRLLHSADFAGLVEQLASVRRGRVGVKPYDYHGALHQDYRRQDFVGRQWLFERIARSLEGKDRGFIVLSAGPGFGKTAFLLEFIERFRDKGIGTTAIGSWHIIRKNNASWVPAFAMVEQLEWRLRDRLGCPLSASQATVKVENNNAAAILQEALREAAAKLGPSQRLLLVVDGIDEGFGANVPFGTDQGKLLHQIFPDPSELPQGIFVLFASAPGAHLLSWQQDPPNIIELDRDTNLQAANRADLYAYLEHKLMGVINCGDHDAQQIRILANRMTDECEGSFSVAVWFANAVGDPVRFAQWLDGNDLPRGIANEVATGRGVDGFGDFFPWLWRDNSGDELHRIIWPVSVGATVGLDRSRQITVCVGVDPQQLLDELIRVEKTLQMRDRTNTFGRRDWMGSDGLRIGYHGDSVVRHFTTADLKSLRTDLLEGIVESHFVRRDDSVGKSLVLVFPLGADATARHISNALKGSPVIKDAVSVELLGREAGLEPKSAPDAEWHRLMIDFETLENTPSIPEALVRTPRKRLLADWLLGKVEDEDFFSKSDVRDVRLALLAGRFGRSGEYPPPNAIRRTVALARSASVNPKLLFVFGSLPVTPEFIDVLVAAPPEQRAVAGLISIAEMSHQVPPWFHSPIVHWRHGRLLNVVV
jgi:hypothetical protein